MNEALQLRAIAAELHADGWKVVTDVPVEAHGIPAALQLDILAERPEGLAEARSAADASEAPQRLIIEVPNRRRVWFTERATGPDAIHWAAADEVEAMRRLDLLMEALSGDEHAGTALQVRFFDSSVDQAQARQLTGTPLHDAGLRAEIELTRRSLIDAAASEGRELALLTVFHWCRWLRILGHRFPGRGRVEMKLADLRTIQKDLFDAGILEMSPATYFDIHQSVFALQEGGDVDWRAVERLGVQLDRLLNHVQSVVTDKVVEADPPARGRSGVELFDIIEVSLKLLDPGDAPRLGEQLQTLRATDGLPAFRQALLDFEDLAEPYDLLRQQFPALRALARQIRQI